MSTYQPFDVLLFDLGGVLIDFAGFEEMGPLLSKPLPRAVVRQRWISSESVRLFERGEMTPRQFADGSLKEWNLAMAPDAFLDLFTGWARGLYPGAGQLLGRIRKEYRLACLSNSNELHTPLHRDAIGPFIDRCFFSNEIGSVKPEAEIFDHVVQKLAVDASRVCFFDDTAVNVEAAQQAGLTAFLTDGIVELEDRLDRLGILNQAFSPTARNLSI